MSILSNKYHRVWHTLMVGAKWVGHSSMVVVHFGLMHAWDYGCSVLRHGNLGLLSATLDLGCDNPHQDEICRLHHNTTYALYRQDHIPYFLGKAVKREYIHFPPLGIGGCHEVKLSPIV